jgi:DNA-binding beta-propeller fold protein YncE
VGIGMEIEYRAPDAVRAVIGALGQTEDVRFSPSNHRLAIAAFNRHRVVVLDVDIAKSGATQAVALTGCVEISSPALNYPHGLDFLDEETLVVANRNGDVAIFKLPPAGNHPSELLPVQTLAAGKGSLLNAPGSVAVIRRDQRLSELLICNNSGHSVTRHLIDRSADCSVTGSAVLLKKWLNLPDGVCVSDDRRWIAVSNHNTHGVLLYECSPSLSEYSSPDGVLRGVYFPHGLRFSSDGQYLFVADAGAPFVHIYASDGRGWRGGRNPAASLRIMDEPLFLRGRQNPQEGGPKGIDVASGMNVLVATSEHQPLVFYDMAAILAKVPSETPVMEVEYEFGILEQAERLQMRADQAEARARKAKARAQAKVAPRAPAPSIFRSMAAKLAQFPWVGALTVKARLTICRDNS